MKVVTQEQRIMNKQDAYKQTQSIRAAQHLSLRSEGTRSAAKKECRVVSGSGAAGGVVGEGSGYEALGPGRENWVAKGYK